jgi:hypothetical protein
MRARYTAKDQKPVDIDIREFAAVTMAWVDGSGRWPTPDVDKVGTTLARLIDVLAEKGSLSGGEVLAVLGFTDGQLELDDGTPRNDAEWRDYWADRDAAFSKEREALHAESIGLRAKMAECQRGMALEQPVDLGEVPFEPRVEKITPQAPSDHSIALAIVLGLSVERAWPDLLADVAKLNHKCAERGVLIDAIRSEIEDCEDARDAVMSIAERLVVSVKP